MSRIITVTDICYKTRRASPGQRLQVARRPYVDIENDGYYDGYVFSEVRSIFSFAEKHLQRAFQDTIGFFGWNKRTLVIPVLFVVGVIADWSIRGWESVREELLVALAYGFIPVGGFTVLLFVYNWIAAPSRIIREYESENQLLRARRPTQAALNQLADLLSEGIHEILNRPVTNEQQLGELREYEDAWNQRLFQHLDSEFSRADAVHVQRLGSIVATGFAHAYSEAHNRILMHFSTREQRIRDLLRRGVP